MSIIQRVDQSCLRRPCGTWGIGSAEGTVGVRQHQWTTAAGESGPSQPRRDRFDKEVVIEVEEESDWDGSRS